MKMRNLVPETWRHLLRRLGIHGRCGTCGARLKHESGQGWSKDWCANGCQWSYATSLWNEVVKTPSLDTD